MFFQALWDKITFRTGAPEQPGKPAPAVGQDGLRISGAPNEQVLRLALNDTSYDGPLVTFSTISVAVDDTVRQCVLEKLARDEKISLNITCLSNPNRLPEVVKAALYTDSKTFVASHLRELRTFFGPHIEEFRSEGLLRAHALHLPNASILIAPQMLSVHSINDPVVREVDLSALDHITGSVYLTQVKDASGRRAALRAGKRVKMHPSLVEKMQASQRLLSMPLVQKNFQHSWR